MKGSIGPTGTLTLARVEPYGPMNLRQIWARSIPRPAGQGWFMFKYKLRNFKNVWRGLWRYTLASWFGIPTFTGILRAVHYRAEGGIVDYGIISMRVVTTVGAEFIVDAFQNTTELENLRYHGYGTGGAAEAVGNTALTTELTTQYATDNTRPTGSQTENGSTVFRTVGTLDPDADVAITEHGIFSQAATGGGTLLDRSLFSVINLTGATGDALQTTYDFTVNTGG